MIVVKLGGSLYDHPALRVGLNRWLKSIPSPICLVPGGGAFAETVRAFDRLHNIGKEAAHWAAIRSMAIALELLKSITQRDDIHHFDVFNFCTEDDQLPQTWNVTSDSIALRIAIVRDAEKLILLKSQDRPVGSWDALAELGFVDRHFPILAQSTDVPIEAVNFRHFLDAYMKVEST